LSCLGLEEKGWEGLEREDSSRRIDCEVDGR